MANNETCDSVARIISAASLSNSQTDSTITVAETVGKLEAGTVIPSGTSAAEILTMILAGGAPTGDVTIYYGATENPPTSIEGLTSKVVSASELINEFKLRIVAGNTTTQKAEYPVIALPTSFSLTKWFVADFPYNIPFTKLSAGSYDIYCLEEPSYDVIETPPGIEYSFTISA